MVKKFRINRRIHSNRSVFFFFWFDGQSPARVIDYNRPVYRIFLEGDTRLPRHRQPVTVVVVVSNDITIRPVDIIIRKKKKNVIIYTRTRIHASLLEIFLERAQSNAYHIRNT